MTRAENVYSELSRLMEGTDGMTYIHPIVRESRGVAYTDEWQAGGINRASDVTTLMVYNLCRQVPASQTIHSIILRIRSSPEFPLLMFESRAIRDGIRSLVDRAYTCEDDDVSPVGDRLVVSLVCWVENRE